MKKEKYIFIDVSSEPPDLKRAFDFVKHDEAGAVNMFTGTTRNHHDGKTVVELYYDCYREMAVSELRKIADKMVDKYNLKRIYLVHRTGLVPVGEASVILAVSAAHRKEVFAATAEAMDLIKQDVPIWKRESYGNETVWKEELFIKSDIKKKK
ncbi:MAG: molybdenum cofactor biosynthesis protein MoaE [Balneolaceae bacterium]